MTQTLPAPIVTPLMALAQELSACALAHPDASLADQEPAVLDRIRAALPPLLEATLVLTTRSLDGR